MHIVGSPPPFNEISAWLQLFLQNISNLMVIMISEMNDKLVLTF